MIELMKLFGLEEKYIDEDFWYDMEIHSGDLEECTTRSMVRGLLQITDVEAQDLVLAFRNHNHPIVRLQPSVKD